jgi:hypothetical protein
MIAPSLRPPYLRGLGRRRGYRFNDRSGTCHGGEVWWGETGYCRERGVGQQYAVIARPSSPA